MTFSDEPLEVQVRKYRKINEALMARVERASDISGSAFALFQTAIALEEEVRTRTQDLQRALGALGETNARLEQARAEAEEARGNLADALEAVQEGFALFDPDDVLVMCNTRFRALLPDVSSRIQPGVTFRDYVRAVACSEQLFLAQGRTPEDWIAHRLDKHQRRHATFIVALKEDRWIQVSERRTSNGGSAILQTDITDMVHEQRREREKILDEHARLAQATLEHLAQGVCTFDERRRIANCNSRFREFLNLPAHLAMPGASLSRIIEFIRGAGVVEALPSSEKLDDWLTAAPRTGPARAEYRRGDGAVFAVSLRGVPGGGFLVSLTDVTAERQAAAELRRSKETLEQRVAERTAALTAANEALKRECAEREQIGRALRAAKETAEATNLSKTRFLAAASHDLLQPMNAAKLFLSSLEEMRLGAEPAQVVRRLSGAFHSIETLLHALLEISRLDAGSPDYALSDFPLSAVLEPLEQEFRPMAEARGLRLRVRPCALRVRSDPRYFRRIAQNLVANAVAYTRQGSVLVACRRRGDCVRFEVRDSGPGLKPEDHERIFEEFQRLEPEANARGMGLGLSIVRRACQLLGHKLTLRSAPGRGSMFAFDVPLARSTAPAETEKQEAGEPGPTDLNLIAAVVDNEPDVLVAMTQTLERWGASVAPAGSTSGACAAMADLGLPPDVIIADYHLDGDDNGLHCIEKLRAAWGAQIPAVLVTADYSAALAAKAREAGVDILPKPVEPRKLRSLITWRGLASV